MSIFEKAAAHFNKDSLTPAQTVVQEVCRIKKNETVLIVANPETSAIAQQLYSAAIEAGAKAVLMYQPKKPSMEAAEPSVIGALKSEPDVFFSISAIKLGKDKDAIAHPYVADDGEKYDHIFDFLLHGKKTMRSIWTPGLTEDMFNRTVNIDYKVLASRCTMLCNKYQNVVSVHVTSPNGTDVIVPVKGRKGLSDNGDFSLPGSGGNIPAGEVFISPVVGGTVGTIVFDGSMTFSDGDAILKTPITVKVADGFVTDITGGEEAKRLLKDVTAAEKEALVMEKTGKLPAGQGAIYSKDARNIGELGIGLNPAATITGNMLEDEKAFRTCHFAVGMNYDGDAPALIHFDGVVRNPTITFTYADGKKLTVLNEGTLVE
jgi:leucyl aminopeptidase (aminopeptidase T)